MEIATWVPRYGPDQFYGVRTLLTLVLRLRLLEPPPPRPPPPPPPPDPPPPPRGGSMLLDLFSRL